MNDERWQARSRSGEQVDVQRVSDGPALVRHADFVIDARGVEHPVVRPVVAVCICKKSQRLPWCDSTHKLIRRRSASENLSETAALEPGGRRS